MKMADDNTDYYQQIHLSAELVLSEINACAVIISRSIITIFFCGRPYPPIYAIVS
jgi:hypothetical protein